MRRWLCTGHGHGRWEGSYDDRRYMIIRAQVTDSRDVYTAYVRSAQSRRYPHGWEWRPIGWKYTLPAAKAFVARHVTTGYEMA